MMMEPSLIYELTMPGELSPIDLSSFAKGSGEDDSCGITVSSSTSSVSVADGDDLEQLVEKDKEVKLDSQKAGWLDFFLEPRVSQGNHSLPLQAESRPWLKYLIWVPISSIVSMGFFAYFWLTLFLEKGMFEYLEGFTWNTALSNRLVMIIIATSILLGIFLDIAMDIYTFVMLARGKRCRHLPAHIPRLVHAVIVCNYKEPLDVLRATIASLADNTLAPSTIVVLACEARDTTAEEIFDTLASEFQGSFRSFFKTTHELTSGEIVGKSSNENFACQELYKYVEAQGIDPFSVMVTTCDADSLFDRVFLEQVEAEYCRMPDGRRFLYNSPINTYRNVAECHPLVKAFEIRRCQFDLFNGMSFRPAQSNYSLTLGFAQEINFWDPTNTSEDFHTTLKAMAMTGKGTEVVVRVWSLILNDSVTSFADRWTQAKRHMWGIEELAFVATLFPALRFNQWSVLFSRVSTQMFGVCIPAMIWCMFQPVRDIFFSLRPETRYLLVAIYVVATLYDWVKCLVREIFLYRLFLSKRELMMKRSVAEWLQLFLVWPVLASLSTLVFATMATWSVLIHAVRHETLVYVTAPKALNVQDNNTGISTSRPKKSV